jgi:hypothetical protein
VRILLSLENNICGRNANVQSSCDQNGKTHKELTIQTTQHNSTETNTNAKAKQRYKSTKCPQFPHPSPKT